MIEEEFRAIKGYEGLYEVSNYGRVRSLMDSHKRARILVLKARVGRYGYLFVGLWKDGKMKEYYIHRLVAEAFIPNPDGLPEVNHINECKQSNVATNLEWCNHFYNMRYGTGHQRSAEKHSKRVYQYTKSGSFVRSYPSVAEAARQTGMSQGNIAGCCRGAYGCKSAGGYIWSYDPLVPKGQLF